MMVNSIYASKLYKTSNRRSKIHAALNDSSNLGLVQQLSSYLDEEYQDLAEEKEKKKPQEGQQAESSDSSEASEESNFSLPDSLNPGLGSDFHPEDNLVTVDEDIEGLSNTEDGASEEPVQEEKPATVEEATQIKACTDIDLPLDVMKGSLNSVEGTQGADRLLVKDNELWIYYNDSVNLNNIMTAVIEYLNASGYTNLEFNRLARSDNAIVFVINNVLEPIKPIETVQG